MEDLPIQAELSGPPILKDEVRWGLKNMKTRKAPGPDEVVTGIITA